MPVNFMKLASSLQPVLTDENVRALVKVLNGLTDPKSVAYEQFWFRYYGNGREEGFRLVTYLKQALEESLS